MNIIDLLIEIRKTMSARLCNYSLVEALTEDQWREFVYKCICAAVTEDQISQLIDLGIEKEKIYDILNIGKDCGICLKKGDKCDNKCEKSKAKNI
jgi:bacterioferritin-associated ferredoxin